MVLSLVVAGCGSTASDRLVAPHVALVGIGPILGDSALDSEQLCDAPIKREKARCPVVHEKRVWMSEDGAEVACRLSVCGEDRVWRRSQGRWQDSTFRLR